jgi:hypothetical protein
MAVTYRLMQGVRALLAFSQTVDSALAHRHLSGAQMALFLRMSKSEQLHSLNVLRDVLAQEAHTPPDLAVGALLHDVGKSRYALNTAQRTVSVLVKKCLPQVERRLSATQDLTWLNAPFVVRRHHPLWSAELLREAGGSETAIWLVAHHADDLALWAGHPHVGLLARLKTADDQN